MSVALEVSRHESLVMSTVLYGAELLPQMNMYMTGSAMDTRYLLEG